MPLVFISLDECSLIRVGRQQVTKASLLPDQVLSEFYNVLVYTRLDLSSVSQVKCCSNWDSIRVQLMLPNMFSMPNCLASHGLSACQHVLPHKPTCPLCVQAPEMIEHLLIQFPFACEVLACYNVAACGYCSVWRNKHVAAWSDDVVCLTATLDSCFRHVYSVLSWSWSQIVWCFFLTSGAPLGSK